MQIIARKTERTYNNIIKNIFIWLKVIYFYKKKIYYVKSCRKRKEAVGLKILFVCTGNTCRSPLAEGIMNKKAEERKLSITAESAGLAASAGDEVSVGSILAARALEIDISSHRSRPFNLYMTEEFDLFAVMSENHKKVLSMYVPERKIRVLGGGIPDPYGGNEETYLECAKIINESIDELLNELCSIEIHLMTENDVDGIEEIEKECFSTPWTRDGILSELTNKTARFFVAEFMGETAGYLGMHIVLDECYIANIAVKEEFRRKGIADKLLSVGEERAKEENCTFISLEVRVSNEKAIALYRKRGYNEMGERKNFYSDPVENALIMTKDFQ